MCCIPHHQDVSLSKHIAASSESLQHTLLDLVRRLASLQHELAITHHCHQHHTDTKSMHPKGHDEVVNEDSSGTPCTLACTEVHSEHMQLLHQIGTQQVGYKAKSFINSGIQFCTYEYWSTKLSEIQPQTMVRSLSFTTD